KKTLKTGVTAMVREVYAHSRMSQHSHEDAHRFIVCWQSKEHDPWRICCGHDLAFALGRALQFLVGTQNAASVSCEQIESRLRLAYGPEDFRATKLFEQIGAW